MNEDITTGTHVCDPVCGMDIRGPPPIGWSTPGRRNYFCGVRCVDAFRKDPEAALAKPSKPEAAGSGWSARKSERGSSPPATTKATGKYICPMCPGVASDGPTVCPKCGMALETATPMPGLRQVQYTCPMHPEVLQDAPGECPKCGMALEPTTMSAEEKNAELVDMTRRFWAGAALTVLILILAMGSYLPGLGPFLERSVPNQLSHWLEFALATPVVLWAGWPFFQRGWKSVATWRDRKEAQGRRPHRRHGRGRRQ